LDGLDGNNLELLNGGEAVGFLWVKVRLWVTSWALAIKNVEWGPAVSSVFCAFFLL
jgi:hypothetical protein